MTFLPEYISVPSLSLTNKSTWIYLADWILALILGLAFIFYFNRLVGFIVSKILQLVLWKYHKVEINIESCRISFLGGRFFAKNLVIINSNETISILHLNFTWRYWIFKPTRLAEYFVDKSGDDDSRNSKENSHYPTRFTLLIEGLEHFMYNRIVAYDNIMDFLNKEDNAPINVTEKTEFEDGGIRRRTTTKSSSSASEKEDIRGEHEEIDNSTTPTDSSLHTPQPLEGAAESNSSSMLKTLLRLFPVSVKIKKGALIIGNPSTPTLIVASFQTADTIVDIANSPSPLDLYRQVFNFQFENLKVSLKPNLTYREKQTTEKKQNGGVGVNLKLRKKYKIWFKFRKSIDVFFNTAVRKFTRNRFGKNYHEQNEDDHLKNWRGLRRYVGDASDDQNTPGFDANEEYAKYSLILDSTSTRLIYYYDVPGLVSALSSVKQPAPEFGIYIELSVTTIHYGPWADKQRIPLQSLLFPTLNRDTRPTEIPLPGMTRNYKGFDLFIEVKDEVIFRIPTREQSKDLAIIKNFQQQQQAKHNNQHLHHHHHHSDKNQNVKSDPDDQVLEQSSSRSGPTRSFGWLELKIKPGSNLASHTSYIATKEDGWPNSLSLNFIGPELRSSVNHDLFFQADSHNISAKVGFPLGWNEKCNWEFQNISKNAEIFFLREHTMIFSDIFTDFASGAPTPYELFRSFHYQFNWKFQGYKLYMNVNDSNIIDNPLEFANNKFLSFQGDSLEAEISIPLHGNFTKSNTVNYNILTTFFNLVLDTPPWHTTNAFMEQTKLMGRANYFTIDGSYTYFTSVEINTSDHIVIDMKGDYVTLKCYGFIVRYLLSIRENYFGDNVHFKTFEEYSQEKQNTSNSESSSVTSADSSDLSSSDTTNSDINYWKIGRAENDIDVLFAFKVRQGLCLLPCNLYDSKKHIGLRFDSLDVDIRFTNYYMDFQADITPIDGVLVKQDDGLDAYNTTSEIIFDIPKYTEKYLKKPNLTIVGLSIHGHRMFGLPPVEPTYYCKWDIATGDIVIDSSGSFLKGLIASVGGLAVGYTDLENELVVHIPTLYDVTFLSFSCPKIHIGLHHESMGSDFELPIDADSTLNIDISSILFTFNDLANDRYTSKLSLIIPKIEVKLLKKIEEGFKVLMFFQFELNLNNISQKRKFLEHRRLQQNHIRTNDAPFHRCPFLLYPVERDDVYMDAMGCFITSLTLPDVAAPMNKDSATTSTSIADSENYPSVLDFEDESYPPSSSSSTATSTATSSQSSFASNNSTSKMKPTTNYSNEDFCPDYDIDPKYEYDNFIFDLSSIDAFISPRALSPLAKILQSFQGLDLTSLIDELQRSILRKLVALIYPGSTNVNFRFVAPEINLRVGDFDVSSPLEMLQSPKVPVINMSIVEPSFAFSEKTTNEKVSNGGSDSLNTTVELSGAVHIKEILLSISNPSEFVLAGSFDLENIEFWFTKSPTTSNNELVCSHAIDKIEVNFSTDQIEWVSNYILRMHEIIEPSLEEFKNFVEASEKAIPELVYMISKAGKEFHIDYDPDVLTKPAYILRSCRDHTRFHDSWKLMTRIRHVFDNLPEAWKENLYQSIEDNKWELPATASEEFLSIFSRWRTWEVGDVEQSYLFKEVFEKLVKIKELALLANFRADFGNICFNIRDESNKSNDFIELDNVNFTFGVNTERKVDLNSIGGLGIFEVLQKLEGVFNVISYKSKISTITFDILPKILDIKKEFGKLNKEHVLKEEHKISSIPKNQIDKFISFIASIKSFRQQLLLPYTSLELRGNSVAFTAQTYILSQSKVIPFTFSTVADEYALDLWGENQIISNSMEGLFFLVGNFGSLERGIKYGKVEIKKISIYLSEQEMCLTRAIQSIIDEDVPYVQKLITAATPEKELPPEASATPTSTEPFRSLYNKVGDVFLDFNLEELSWSLDVLFPLTYNGKVISSHFSLNVMEEAVYIELLIQRFDSIFSIKRKNMIRLENSQIQTNIKFLDSKKMYFAVCSMDIGFTKVVLPQISQTMELILKNLVLLQERVNTFQEIALDFIPSENTSIESNTLKTDKNNTDFAFKFNFSNDYIGVSSFLDRSKISFELEGFSFGTYNIANVNKEEDQSTKYLLVPIYGELVIPTARISILDRSIPVGLSSILDVNVTLKVLNSSQENDKAQSLQLESQYCRICTSPQVLFKIIELVDSVVNVISTHPITKLKKKKNVEIPKERKPFELPFASINILSYNFCFGWLFGDPNLKSYPGIIVGAERFFAVVEETVGKFTLMEAYLSVANGSRSSNYYSSLSEKNNLNRAYLPTMQIIYLMEKVESARNLRMHIFGDELDVKFLSDSIAIIEHAVKSGTKVQAFFNKRVRPTLHQPGKAPSRSPSPAENGEDENPLHAYFTSIECVYSFAGSNILLYRFNDGNSTTAEPSLYLHSPAVRVATMYKHKKEIESGSNERKHTIKIEVLTSPFDNTLYASCVPVILDIVDGVKRMMKSDSNPTASVAPVIATSSTQSSDFKLGDLLKDIDIHFRVRIEKQKLSLSCEPTAKVEAVVAIGGIDFQINSLNESPKALTSILQFESVSSTLQHVYSREVSGSIIIREIILSSKIDFGSVTRILSAGSLSDVSGYINVKQFQDLNLFKDIWLPKDYLDELHTEYESVKESISNKNLSERAKEVSTTYAVPWDLTLMITNIVLQVDFGQSLGNFNLNSNKIWVISNKTTDWGQDLKVGIDNISLTLKGRLGGTLEIKNVYLHAGISWKDGENILDIPLIILSGDVEHLQLKSSFDYHVFALANIKTCSIDIFNQKNEVTAISKDHLYITTKFETAEIYITSFAASNVMDIYNAIFRMVQENKNSYRETLRDSRKNVSKALTRSLSSPSTGGSAVHTTSSNVKRLSSGSVKSVSPHTSSSTQSSTPSKKLVSKIEVIAGHFLIHVYPSSFDDSKVMVVKLDGSQINFDESEYEDGIANDLKVQFNGLKVSLSKTSTLLEDFILTSTVNQFVEHAHKATGGTIFVFPSFKISMKTFQKYESYLIEYFFQSSFGGTVGIRWNLGSINFIREMFAIHKRALASRTSYKQEAGGAVKVSKIEVDKDVPPLEKKAVNENFDEAINATIDKVSDESKYIYQALAIPIIEAPQLKELGNATPPLEWFGLHREKFPNVTHQLGIVSLQKFIHEIEVQYSKVLGKA